jgi:cation diffusion facilitator CzcD-associated flavoprotein CzcO
MSTCRCWRSWAISPTEKYAKGDEILALCRRIAERCDLFRDVYLWTGVDEIRWDPALSRWIISTNHRDSMRARFVAMANGYLQKPKLPGIQGITAFEDARRVEL